MEVDIQAENDSSYEKIKGQLQESGLSVDQIHPVQEPTNPEPVSPTALEPANTEPVLPTSPEPANTEPGSPMAQKPANTEPGSPINGSEEIGSIDDIDAPDGSDDASGFDGTGDFNVGDGSDRDNGMGGSHPGLPDGGSGFAQL